MYNAWCELDQESNEQNCVFGAVSFLFPTLESSQGYFPFHHVPNENTMSFAQFLANEAL